MWSDGTAVTAADFEQAWKKILSPDFPAANAPLFYPIKNAEEAKKGLVSLNDVGIYAIDDQTLVVELKNPTPYFLKLTAFCVFFPVKQTLDKIEPDWMNHAGENYLSNGPFMLKSWQHNNEIVLEKNPYYWESNLIPLEKIQVSMVKDENTVLQMYENGELDFVGTALSPIPNDVLPQYQQKGLLKSHTSAATTAVTFNVSQFPFTNKSIRKAFALAIDRQEIVDNITQLGEEVATGVIPSCLKTEKASSYFEDHDLIKAKQYFSQGLKELGIEAGEFPVLTYDYSFSELNHKLAQTLQQQWSKNLGVKIELQHCEHKVFLDKLTKRDYTLAQMFWFAQYHDPMSILERFKYHTNPKNYCNWEDPTYISLLEQTIDDETPEERTQTLETAEALLLEEMPLTPLYHWKTVFMLKDYITYEAFPPDHGFLEITRIGIKKQAS
jgi:oligopeptide transport system substrate-binding protein